MDLIAWVVFFPYFLVLVFLMLRCASVGLFPMHGRPPVVGIAEDPALAGFPVAIALKIVGKRSVFLPYHNPAVFTKGGLCLPENNVFFQNFQKGLDNKP